jgi:hypothetical protein
MGEWVGKREAITSQKFQIARKSTGSLQTSRLIDTNRLDECIGDFALAEIFSLPDASFSLLNSGTYGVEQTDQRKFESYSG